MNFLIKYKVLDKDGILIKEGEMRVKNKKDSMDAQIQLEKYLKKKYKHFNKLIVDSCERDIDATFNAFEDLFGPGNNPFKN